MREKHREIQFIDLCHRITYTPNDHRKNNILLSKINQTIIVWVSIDYQFDLHKHHWPKTV